jgi:mannosyltransferase OCH1-like enzyme
MRNNLWLNGGIYGDKDGLFNKQTAPSANTGTTINLTAANLLDDKLIQSTNASAVTVNLPTGAVLDAYFQDLPNNASFDWSVINTGSTSGAATVTAATGHTIVGAAVVAISTAGLFRTRKTADGVFVTYRIS